MDFFFSRYFIFVGVFSARAIVARNITCDIVVAGGSTSSLAAAITAAEAAPELSVCFTEITDWPGGQMTAGGVPAIDFGGPNSNSANQPASFRSAMDSIPGDGAHHTATIGSGSPGACSVSTKCYDPAAFVRDWVRPRLQRSKNLQVFLRSAVVHTERDSVNGSVIAVHVVQRTPRPSTQEWSARLSEELSDWYDSSDSAAFTKELLVLRGRVFIEATELGDILATSGLPWLQGIETPFENSSTIDTHCGQAATLTFYAQLLDSPAPAPSPTHPALPVGNGAGQPWTKTLSLYAFEHTWTWRRAFCAANRSLFAINVGDITQQNLGNDLDTAYLLLSSDDARLQAEGGWAGGVNLTAMRMLEDRAYGWFSLLKNSSDVLFGSGFSTRLDMNRTTSGTLHGLSKMVYWRDTRRAVGVGGFKLVHTQLRDTSGPTGTHFNDTIALGDYNDDTHHLAASVCTYPKYMVGRGEGAKPYYVPFRALMVGGAPNLLAAGKLMAQSFHANSNTRLHPSEWTTGVAAGGAAVLMARQGWTSSDALAHISTVQMFLNSTAVGQPLEWAGLPPEDDMVGDVCALQRCLSVDRAGANAAHGHVYNDSKCALNCAGLQSYEWLANADFWDAPKNVTAGTVIHSNQPTVLKKSTANSHTLPPNMVWQVGHDAPCRLVSPEKFDNYWLCIHHT